MAVTVQAVDQISTVTDTTNIRVNISEVIDMLSPDETPLLSLIGRDSLKFPCTQVKHEYLEDELEPRETTLAADYSAGSGTLEVASGAGKQYSEDDLILVGDNVLQVLSGPPDSDVFVVVGGLGNSTDSDATSGATVRKIASALPEGSVSRVETTKTELNRPYNYTQILKDQTVISGTMEHIRRYGYASERAYQEEKVLRQLAIDMEHELLYGVRSYQAGPPRRSTMGGLFDFVYLQNKSQATVHDAAGGQLTEKMFNDVLQAIWEQGGKPDTVLLNGYNKRLVTAWETPRIRTSRDEETGGASIARYESEFGVVRFVLDRWLRASDIPILTQDQIGIGPLQGRAFGSRRLPSLGDYTQTEVLGEYTMEVHKGGQAHGWIYNTATS